MFVIHTSFGFYPSPAGPEAKVHSAVITGVYAARPRRTFAPSAAADRQEPVQMFGLLRLVQAECRKMSQRTGQEINNI